jgi:hypothetical protein
MCEAVRITAGKVAEAAREFEKGIRHRGIVVSDPMGAMALLQLARAYALAGDARKARAAYEDFLSCGRMLIRTSRY